MTALDTEVRRFIRNRRRLIGVLNEQKQAIINRAVTRGLDPNVPLKPSGIDWLGDIQSIGKSGKSVTLQLSVTVQPLARGNMTYWSGGTYPWLNSGSVNGW